MSARKAYFDDLLKDCYEAVSEAKIPTDKQPVIVAALIQSDSLNGLRKALLQGSALGHVPPALKGWQP